MLNDFYGRLYMADAHADTATACGDDYYCNPKCQLDLSRAAEFLSLQVFAFWQRPRNLPWLEWQTICRSCQKFTAAVLGCAGVDILKNKEQLADITTTWAVLELEGVDCFGWLSDKKYFLDEMLKANFKIVGLFWNNNNWLGCGADCNRNPSGDTGLTLKGKRFLQKFAEYPFIVDLAHSSRRSFAEVCEIYPKPLLVSHTCCDSICSHPRNLTDQQLKAVGDTGGFVGIAFYPYFLTGEAAAGLDDIVGHLNHAVKTAGESAVGLGSDFDGVEVLPDGISGAESLERLAEKLRQKGWGYSLIEKVMGLNLRDFLQANL